MQKTFIGLSLASILAGCSQQAAQAPQAKVAERDSPELSINQGDLCEVQQWQHDDVAASCKPGQKVVFLPGRWGNEQLPVIFAAVNCDLRYQIALTNGGVTCIYGPITVKPAQPAAPPASAPAAKPGKA